MEKEVGLRPQKRRKHIIVIAVFAWVRKIAYSVYVFDKRNISSTDLSKPVKSEVIPAYLKQIRYGRLLP